MDCRKHVRIRASDDLMVSTGSVLSDYLHVHSIAHGSAGCNHENHIEARARYFTRLEGSVFSEYDKDEYLLALEVL
jgi:hypothetical protein